jgi:rhomboid protease GluP
MPPTLYASHPKPTRLRYLAAPYTVTTTLIAANTLVFLAMLASGISFIEPTLLDVFRWGGDYFPATIGAHQYWRLFTSTFLHFGIIHIGMNMWVLFLIGPFIEITFGRFRYVLIYLAAGLFGSIVSVYVHPHSVSAGASGAIFGLYGAVFAFLLRNRRTLAPAATKSIGRSAGIFVLYNVIYGSMSGTTDLSAHFGGLIAGFVAGLVLAPSRRALQSR